MNTPCHRTAREVLLFRDGELSPAEREAFAGHLPGCSSCRARLDDAKALALLLREVVELSAGPLPSGFADRVMGDIRRRPPAPVSVKDEARAQPWSDWLFGGWRWLAVGGLALAAAVATVVLPMLSASRNTLAPLDEAEQAVLRQENEAHVHRLSVDSAGTHSVVLQTAEGRTVIWMISDSQFGEDAGPENP